MKLKFVIEEFFSFELKMFRFAARSSFRSVSRGFSSVSQKPGKNLMLFSLTGVAIGLVASPVVFLDGKTKVVQDKAVEDKPKEDKPKEGEDGEEKPAAAYNPETGEINWDCPCLGGMAHGPCGEEFKEAFSCFVYSEAEPKGIDCVEKFKNMQNCFRKYPEIYSEEIRDDETPVDNLEPAGEVVVIETEVPATKESAPKEAIVEIIPVAEEVIIPIPSDPKETAEPIIVEESILEVKLVDAPELTSSEK